MSNDVASDGIATAQLAGLRYTNDDQPGIRRKRSGRGFAYTDRDGVPIRDKGELGRIRRLAIPPAWTDVWISPSPIGHIQATGRDARGRKQYRYHERWREVRDEAKYGRLIDFAKALPRIRKRVDADLARPGVPRERVLATAVRILDQTFMRVGNSEYARENGSFGLTTLRSRHVEVVGSRILFRFRGKSGKDHEVDVRDRRLARVVTRLEHLPGQELFRYLDDEGEPRAIGSEDVNAYLGEISGEDLTAKDFRTWAGTVLAARALAELGSARNERVARKRIVQAVDVVAARLGNTRAICRKCYVHPAIIDAYEAGGLPATLRRRESWPLDARNGRGRDVDSRDTARRPSAGRVKAVTPRVRGKALTADARPAPEDRGNRGRRRR